VHINGGLQYKFIKIYSLKVNDIFDSLDLSYKIK
jgi:hypothetical protein